MLVHSDDSPADESAGTGVLLSSPPLSRTLPLFSETPAFEVPEEHNASTFDDLEGIDLSGSAEDIPVLFPEENAESSIFSPKMIGAIAGVIISVVLHLWAFAMLAKFTIVEPEPRPEIPIFARNFDETRVIEIEPEKKVKFELANPNDKEMEVREVMNARSTGLEVVKDPTPRFETITKAISPAIAVGGFKVFDIPEGRELNEHQVVVGTTGEGMMQIESALDRVTWEIANQLKERKVLVVWLIDASASLIEQRAAIAKRLNRIYGELGALQQVGQIMPRTEQPLLSSVVMFGEKTEFVVPEPTPDSVPIIDALKKSKTDSSGRENVFTAVDQVMHRYGKYRANNSRSIMLIVVTDETGDDFAALEPAILSCKRQGAKAFVVGPSAVFGRREGYVPYKAPEDGKTYQLPVDLGPETFALEAVSLPFWFGDPQYEYLSAGLGPYGLSRLVKETGGYYFMTNMTTMKGLAPLGEFGAENMKGFQPDYNFGTPQAYMDDVARHPIRRAVVMASELSRKYKAKGTPQTELRVQPENYLATLTNAQKSAAESGYMVDMILQPFSQNLENDYKKEPSPRWRTGYNLALGRLLALKVRAYEYNFACAQLKNLGSGDVASKTNHWIFKSDAKLASGPNMKKMADQSEKLLRRVVDEAPGTPWAVLATRELSYPLGFRVIQRYDPPPKRQEVAAKNVPGKPGIRLAREPQKKAPPAKPAPPPVLPKL